MTIHDRSTHRQPWSTAGWGVLGVASLAVLALALVVSDGLGPTLVVTGFASLVLLRLAAMRGRWTSLAFAHVEQHEPTNQVTGDDDTGRSRRAVRGFRVESARDAAAPRVASAVISETSDRVDTASSDSFPASDPPAWTGARVGAPRRLTSDEPSLP